MGDAADHRPEGRSGSVHHQDSPLGHRRDRRSADGATLFDLDRTGAELGPMPEAPQGVAAGLRGRIKQGVSFEAKTTAGDLRSAIGTGTDFVKEAVTDPIGVATSAGEMAASLSRMLAPASEPLSSVFGDRSLSVYFDLIDIPLDDLKKAGKAGRGTPTTLSLPVLPAGCVATTNDTERSRTHCA